jgi:hypothetical protein
MMPVDEIIQRLIDGTWLHLSTLVIAGHLLFFAMKSL